VKRRSSLVIRKRSSKDKRPTANNQRRGSVRRGLVPRPPSPVPRVSVGIGYDIHRFAEGRPLWLGGVEIPHGRGLDGHSDADALLHAICDALLGAAGLGDIGRHFPSSDPSLKGIASVELLRRTQQMIVRAGYRVSNIDAVVIAEEPRLGPYQERMCAVIASAADVPVSSVNVKVTSNERMGAIGRAEGIAAYAVVLLTKRLGYRVTKSPGYQ